MNSVLLLSKLTALLFVLTAPIGHTSAELFLSPNKHIWQDAQKECHERGQRLVVVDSQQKCNEIQQWLTQTNRRVSFWIAATDGFLPGNYIWVPSWMPVRWSNWRSGYPKLLANYCTVINDEKAEWTNENCALYYNTLCEDLPATPKKIIFDRICPSKECELHCEYVCAEDQ